MDNCEIIAPEIPRCAYLGSEKRPKYVKRDLCMSKETYVCRKRPNIYVFAKVFAQGGEDR